MTTLWNSDKDKRAKNRCPRCQGWSTTMNSSAMPIEFTPSRSAKLSVLRSTSLLLTVSGFLLLGIIPGQAQTASPDQKTISLEKQQSGLYPNPTVAYLGEEIRGGEQGFFVQQNIVTAGKLDLNRNIFEQEKKQAETEADEQRLRLITNVKISYIQLAAQQTLELRHNLNKLAQDAVETSHQ